MRTRRPTPMEAVGISLISLLMLAWPQAAPAGQKIEATLAAPNGPQLITVRMEDMFVKNIAEKTHGGLVIRLVHSGQLGGTKENLEAIMAGNLEMAQVNNAFLETLYPAVMLFDLPFIFRDNDHMRRVVRGPIGQQIYGELEKKTGIRMLTPGLADGPRSIFNRKHPIRTPEDMKGLKLRVMESPIMVDTFRALGAIPTPMPVMDVYMATRQGVIDGADPPPFAVIDFKGPEVAKYYSLTKHFSMPNNIAVSAKWFDALPKEYQQAVSQAVVEMTAWHDTQFGVEEVASLAEIKKRGMEVNDVADPQAFRNAVKSVYDKYATQAGGWKMIQAVIDTK